MKAFEERQDAKEEAYYEAQWRRVRVGGDGDGDPTYVRSAPRAAVIKTLETRGVIRDGDLAFDVGCGRGRNAIALAVKGMRVTGLDISASAIELARQDLQRYPNLAVDFRHGSVLEPPPLPPSFDLWLDDGLLHHVRRRFWPRYFSILRARTKPGSRVSVNAFCEVPRDRARGRRRWWLEGRHFSTRVERAEIGWHLGRSFEPLGNPFRNLDPNGKKFEMSIFERRDR